MVPLKNKQKITDIITILNLSALSTYEIILCINKDTSENKNF